MDCALAGFALLEAKYSSGSISLTAFGSLMGWLEKQIRNCIGCCLRVLLRSCLDCRLLNPIAMSERDPKPRHPVCLLYYLIIIAVLDYLARSCVIEISSLISFGNNGMIITNCREASSLPTRPPFSALALASRAPCRSWARRRSECQAWCKPLSLGWMRGGLSRKVVNSKMRLKHRAPSQALQGESTPPQKTIACDGNAYSQAADVVQQSAPGKRACKIQRDLMTRRN